jgi:transcriptional regulator with XRE-family HTH domain
MASVKFITVRTTTKFSPERVKEIRTRNGLSITTMAAGVGVSHITAAAWENDHATPRAANLAAMADLLDCSVADFFISVEDDET